MSPNDQTVVQQRFNSGSTPFVNPGQTLVNPAPLWQRCASVETPAHQSPRELRRVHAKNKKLKDRITPHVNFFQQAAKERQRRNGVSKKEKRDGEGLVWSKLCVDEYV